MQTITGPLSDRLGRKGLIVWGMWLQAAALFMVAALNGFGWWLGASMLLGLGTAMVYPTCSLQSRMSRIQPGEPVHSASTGSGATSATRSARCLLV